MSEVDSSDTAILLPTASVTVFTKDNETVETARALADDWRFARVDVNVEEGDVGTAISAYASVTSPDLVVVQTDNIDDSFTERLEELAGNCKEDTAAIVIGPVNDVYLYRKLVGMGVSDYLVRPVKPDVFSEVIAKSLIERIGASGSHLVAVVGAKGGVGASVIAQTLAWAAAQNLNQKTMLMDASGGWSSTSVGMGFEPSTTLQEAIRAAENNDEDSLSRMIFKAGERLSVLATGGDVMLDHALIPDQLEHLLDMLVTKFPVVIFDLSQSPAMAKRTVLARAHEIIMVSSPTLPSLRLARTLMSEVKELRGGTAGAIDLVVNMQGMSPVGEVTKADIEAALECKPSAILPFNPKLFVGQESQSKKLADDKAGADILRALMPLIRAVVGDSSESAEQGEEEKAGGLGQLFSKLKSK